MSTSNPPESFAKNQSHPAVFKKTNRPAQENESMLNITSQHKKFTLIYLLAILFIIVLWLFLGALTVDVQGRGIFMDRGGLYDIEAGTSGTIAQILVQPQEYVKKGESVAIITNHQLEIALKYTEKQLKELEEKYIAKKKSVAKENEDYKDTIQKQIEINNKKIGKLEKEIPALQKSYQNKLELSKQGLVSNSNVLAAEKLLVQRLSSLEITKSTIATLKANLVKTLGTEELNNLAKQILVKKEEKEILDLNLKSNILLSPINARILEIIADVGERVSPGKRIMWIEAAEKGFEDMVVYAVVPGEIAKRIRLNTQILIKPTQINLREYGSIIGEIVDISPFVIPGTEIDTYLHSQGLKDFLLKDISSPFLLAIKPIYDSTTPSGFKWTSSQEYPYKISTGAVSYISGVAYYERPIVRLFPLWKIEYYLDHLYQKFIELISNPKTEQDL